MLRGKYHPSHTTVLAETTPLPARCASLSREGRGLSGRDLSLTFYLVLLVFSVGDAIYLLLAYGKSKQTDLSQKQRKDILAFIEELQ